MQWIARLAPWALARIFVRGAASGRASRPSPNDRLLVEAATVVGSLGPAFIVASAAAQQNPEMAVAMVRSWFAGLGLEVEDLPLRNRDQAHDRAVVHGLGGKLQGLEERMAAVWWKGQWRALDAGRVVLFDVRGEHSFSAGELIVGLPAADAGSLDGG